MEAGRAMHRFSRLVEETVELVSIEMYGVAAVTRGEGLLVTALREGAVNVYHYTGGGLVRLNRAPVSFVAKHPYGVGFAVFGRDVARGKELHVLYRVELDRPGVEEPLTERLGAMRVLGAAVTSDGGVVFAGVREDGIHVYRVAPDGDAVDVAKLPGLGFVTDATPSMAVGLLASSDEPGRMYVLTVDLETGRVGVHKPAGGSAGLAVASPDGGVVYALETASGARLMRLDPESGEAGPLSLPHRDLDEYGPAAFNYIGYTPGGSLLATARKHGRSALFVDGRRVPAPEGMLGQAFEWRGRIVASHASLNTPPRVIEVDPATGGYRALLEGARPWWLGEALGASRFEWVESFDGARVPVYVLESRRAPKPGPTVVLVHGGPFSEDADTWDVFAAALAAAGFHVVMPNYRGSTGYGEEWRLKIVGDPCGGELEDITAAAKWARDSGLASRLYVMGYSYGGYMTLCSLTRKPGLYRAGVAGASVADWEEMYKLSDAAFKQFIDLLFAGKRDLWRERSPITYIENLREPLMLVHPQNDTRTPLKPVLRFIEKAGDLGKRIEAYIAPDMGHAINTVDDVVKILLPALLFLARQERVS